MADQSIRALRQQKNERPKTNHKSSSIKESSVTCSFPDLW